MVTARTKDGHLREFWVLIACRFKLLGEDTVRDALVQHLRSTISDDDSGVILMLEHLSERLADPLNGRRVESHRLICCLRTDILYRDPCEDFAFVTLHESNEFV